MPESVSFDRVAERYDQTRSYPPQVAHQIALGIMEAGSLVEGDAVLEIAVGTGRIALPLLEQELHVTGVDISRNMLALLKQKYAESRAGGMVPGALTVHEADITALPFADGTFPAVVGVHVFHLVSNATRALDEALRVIRPGGTLLVGQDVYLGQPRTITETVQQHWAEIVATLGHHMRQYSGQSYAQVVAALRARGIVVEERMVTTWQVASTPRAATDAIRQRLWSRTWDVPDDVFASSLHELDAWLDDQYGSGIDRPEQETRAFKLASARVER